MKLTEKDIIFGNILENIHEIIELNETNIGNVNAALKMQIAAEKDKIPQSLKNQLKLHAKEAQRSYNLEKIKDKAKQTPNDAISGSITEADDAALELAATIEKAKEIRDDQRIEKLKQNKERI